jgi:hypothetical protein
LTYVVSTTIVTDADKDVLVTNDEEVDYMEADYNNVHLTVNEPTESNQSPTNPFRILPNMKPEDVDPILHNYQAEHSTKERPRVVTQHQGENPPSIPSIQTCQIIDGREPTYPKRQELIKSCRMKPKPNKFFIVDDPDLDDVILFLLGNERRGLLDEKDWTNLGQADSDYKQLVARKNSCSPSILALSNNQDTTTRHRRRYHKRESTKPTPAYFIMEERLEC